MPRATKSGWFPGLAILGSASLAPGQPGGIVGWGANEAGQANPQAGTFIAVAGGVLSSVAIREDHTLHEWGYGLYPPPAGTFSAVDGTDDYYLGLRTDGTLAFWGFGETPVNQLPGGTFRAIAAGRLHALAIRTDGSLVLWGTNPITVPAGNDFISVAAGGNGFSFAVRAN